MIQSIQLALVTCVVAASFGITACGQGEAAQKPTDSEASTTSTTTTTGSRRYPVVEEVKLVRCKISSGGYDVRIANVSCREVGRTLGRWGPRNVFARNDDREGVFLQDGWQCWARLEPGVILNVCMRDDAVISYKFA